MRGLHHRPTAMTDLSPPISLKIQSKMPSRIRKRTAAWEGLARGFVLFAAGQVVSLAIGFAVLVVAARTIGPVGIGIYQFAVSVLKYFLLAATFGVTTLAVREVAANPQFGPRILGEVLVLQVVLATILFVCLIGLAPILAPTPNTAEILDIVGVQLVVGSVACNWFLQARERLGRLALAILFGQLVYGVITPIILVAGMDGVRRYAVMNVTSTALTAVVTLILAIRLAGRPQLRCSAKALMTRCKRSVPFAWSIVMIQIYYTIDFVMLGYIKNAAAVGQYGVAYQIPQGIIALGSFWIIAFYPHLARRGIVGKDDVRHDIGHAVTFALILAVALVLGSVLLAGPLVRELLAPPSVLQSLHLRCSWRTLRLSLSALTLAVPFLRSAMSVVMPLV